MTKVKTKHLSEEKDVLFMKTYNNATLPFDFHLLCVKPDMVVKVRNHPDLTALFGELKESYEGGLDGLLAWDPVVRPMYIILDSDSSSDPASIAHEALHAVHHTLSWMGIPLSEHTNELYAYMLSFLVKHITCDIQDYISGVKP